MRRWGLALALLLSVGVNIGILATLAVRRSPSADRARPEDRRPEERRPAPPAPGETAQEPPPRAGRLADRLGLEGEQRRRFLRIQGRFFGETVRLRTDQAEAFRELRRELSAPAPDRERIAELTRSSARAHLALQQAMVRNVIATREILDPEQEQLFLDIISRLGPPGLGGQPERPRRPLLRQPRRPRWDDRP